jgi:hypothetical protein
MGDVTRFLQPAPATDVATDAGTIIDYAHHEIHGGSSFYVYAIDQDLDQDATMDITMITPDTDKWNHALFIAGGSAGYSLYAFEDSITGVPGGAFVPINRNRNSSKVSGTIVRIKDTFTDLGNLAVAFEVGGGKNAGSIFGARDEMILKRNTQYLFRFTSRVNANRCSLFVDWYEHEDR